MACGICGLVAPGGSVLQRDWGFTFESAGDVLAKQIGEGGVVESDVYENDGGIIAFWVEQGIAAISSGSPIMRVSFGIGYLEYPGKRDFASGGVCDHRRDLANGPSGIISNSESRISRRL
jgi:hypothetical protein